MKYALADVELTDPGSAVEICDGESGVGILVRYKDCPVGYCLVAHPPGRIESAELQTLIMTGAGSDIAEELTARELATEVPAVEIPSVTVAVCTRNHPDYVDRVIRSLLKTKSFAPSKSCEILIVDNAPSDQRTRDIVASCPGVQYVMEPKPGLDFARNRAIQEAHGEILAYVDDDAVVDRWWLIGLHRAYTENPDAGGFTGPVLPFELRTTAQILFERRGGFGRSFSRKRFGPDSANLRNYPCNAGIIGSGCNMAFRRDALANLGGFDEALDTGPPLPGGGDLDMLYRILRNGLPIVYEPRLVIFHQHRETHAALRRQMYTWGLGIMAYAVKNYRNDPPRRDRFRRLIAGWFRTLTALVFKSARSANGWRVDLAFAELWGGVIGLCGEYDRSRLRIQRIRRQYGP